jgi:GTPase
MGGAPGSTQAMADGVRAGERQALARAITLVESSLPEDEARAEELLAALLPMTGKAVRLGITGAPGVGKSTLIEALGGKLLAEGRKVAVLAVDPSSSLSGGSILGDKTRMAGLARANAAFVRPTPSGAAAGGVARRTREAMLVCEAAGYDVVLVETVGTGQTETAVAGMVDLFLLLLSPAAGDELQGIKRGVMELCDVVLVHKADGELAAAAARVREQCAAALAVLRGNAAPPVLAASSLTGAGVDELWRTLRELHETRRQSGELLQRRRQQAQSWLDEALRERVLARFLALPHRRARLEELREAVRGERLLPPAAARLFLAEAEGRP